MKGQLIMSSESYNVYIDDNKGGVGYAHIYNNEDTGVGYNISLYQNRLPLELRNDHDILLDLGEHSKLYSEQAATLLDAVNKVLSFWFMGIKHEMPKVTDSVDIVTDVQRLRDSHSRVLVTKEQIP